MGSSIIGIPTSRITETFLRAQILQQSQANQAALSYLQEQLSSGYRFQTPSEDPIAAMQVMSLQRLLQRKDQVNTNLNTTQSYLQSTDSALSSVFNLLTTARATALGVIGTTSTDTQRQTVAQQINQTIQQLLNTGDQQFRGRYLFSGSESLDAPFRENASGMIEYLGNDQHLMSYSDLNLLTSTNVTGNEAFGVISSEVKGTTTIVPTLTYETQLADLRQGQGITRGSIIVSDGLKKLDGTSNDVTIDLSGAKTIGDVAALIKAHPPQGRQLYVDVTADRLTIRLDPQGGGNLSIHEVGNSTVAEELGIRNETGTGINPIIGRALDPIVRNTTSLDNLFGSYASTVVHSYGSDNDIRLKADVMGTKAADGTDLNDIKVVFQPDPSVALGGEFVDPIAGGVLAVHVAGDGTSRAINVVNAINDGHKNGVIPFSADIDPLDDVNGGLGLVELNASAKTRDGWGEPLDKVHGMRIVNNGGEQTVDFSSAKTLGDVLNVLNGSSTGVIAQINDTKNGIDLLSKVSGCDFEIGENGGKTAAQFGVRSFKGSTPLSMLNFGQGVGTAKNSTPNFAQATMNSPSSNGDVLIRAKKSDGDPNGNYWNGFNISFVDTGDDPPTVNYLPNAQTLTIGIKSGTTTAKDVINAIKYSNASTDFEATAADNINGSLSDSTGLVAPGTAVTKGGTPLNNDFTITRSDGVNLYIDISNAKSIDDVINAINNDPKNLPHPTALDPNPPNLVARLDMYGNGIELVDLSGGKGNLTVTQNPYSTAAVDLGLIPKGKSVSNPGIPDHAATLVPTDPQGGVLIHGRDPSAPIDGVKVIFDHTTSGVVYSENTRTLTVGFDAGVTTANDIVSAINNSPAAVLFQAELAPIPNAGTGSIADGSFTMAGGSATDKAQITTTFPGFDKNIIFSANQAGTAYNNVQINFVGIAGGGTGPIDISRTANVVTINYDSDAPPTANQIVAAWGNAANWSADDHTPPTFTEVTAALDPTNGTPNAGNGFVEDKTATFTAMTTGTTVITGADVNPQETEGVFTALLRMRDAVANNDMIELQRAIGVLDSSTTNLNYTRAELGAREQGLQMVQDSLASQNVDLKSSLSLNYDVDIVTVVSDLTARQTAYQASLMSLGQIMKLSLLNYL